MTSSLLCVRLKKHLKNEGIERPPHEKVNMHTFRRSLRTDMADSNSTLEMISQVLGHSRPYSSRTYLSFSEKAFRECALDAPAFPAGSEACHD